jgi:hypothetical protein
MNDIFASLIGLNASRDTVISRLDKIHSPLNELFVLGSQFNELQKFVDECRKLSYDTIDGNIGNSYVLSFCSSLDTQVLSAYRLVRFMNLIFYKAYLEYL